MQAAFGSRTVSGDALGVVGALETEMLQPLPKAAAEPRGCLQPGIAPWAVSTIPSGSLTRSGRAGLAHGCHIPCRSRWLCPAGQEPDNPRQQPGSCLLPPRQAGLAEGCWPGTARAQLPGAALSQEGFPLRQLPLSGGRLSCPAWALLLPASGSPMSWGTARTLGKSHNTASPTQPRERQPSSHQSPQLPLALQWVQSLTPKAAAEAAALPLPGTVLLSSGLSAAHPVLSTPVQA